MSEASTSEFKGLPMIVLRSTAADQFPFQFGVRKAKLVLSHIEDIRQFVRKNESPHPAN